MHDFERGVERLRARYRVSHDPRIGAADRYLAGDDARRRDELARAIADPDIDAILAARGGYGAMRFAAEIDPAAIARDPKVLVGFSDVTALHALWARAGVCSIHGSMAAGLARLPEASVARWMAALEGEPIPPIEGLRTIAPGVREGRVLGGNLALLSAMVGTPLFPSLEGAILFFEDVGEAPYRIDRMLTQLLLSGSLDGLAGVAIGALTRCGPGPDGSTAIEAIEERLGPLGVPIVAGIASGHIDDPIEIPLGVMARIDGDRGVVTFLHPPLGARGSGA